MDVSVVVTTGPGKRRRKTEPFNGPVAPVTMAIPVDGPSARVVVTSPVSRAVFVGETIPPLAAKVSSLAAPLTKGTVAVMVVLSPSGSQG